MPTEFVSGISGRRDGFEAGSDAAGRAVEGMTADAVDFCQVFCSPHVDYREALEGVRSVIGDDPALIGCAATGIFTEAERVDAGVGLAAVASDRIEFQTGIGTGLSQSTQRAIRDARKGLTESGDDLPYRSALVLYDSLASDGEELAQRIRRKLGARVPFAGGAASDDYRLESTPVFCNDRIEEDAVVVATLDSAAQAHVVDNHGHEPISEPVEVTSSEGRLVRELDGRPAFEVWKDAVRPHAAEMFDIDIDELERDDPLLRQMTAVFEFGIDQGETYKMRACIDTDPEAGAMGALVNIPEGTRVAVMRGTVDSQIESARTAARDAHAASGGAYAGAFVYDCACRDIILGEEFDTAVTEMREVLDTPFVGFETYGEMNMSFGRTSGFHNSTTVISLLPE
jgi:methyl-accepting chemotaxis protein